VPCKKSRLDASRAAALARRHLRPNPGSDADARQLEYRADVSTGPGQPGRLLPVVAGTAAGGRRDGIAIDDSADCVGTSAALWLSADFRGVTTRRKASQPQAGGTDHAGG